MARFVFKLQPLLNVKLQMEDNLKNEMGRAVRKLEEQKGILHALEDEREAYAAEFSRKSGQGTTVERLKEYAVYISVLKQKSEYQKESVKLAKENVDKIREQLIDVVKQRETLEKLKEKKYEDFVKEQLKEENKLVDEIISFTHNKRIAGDANG